MTLHIVDFKVKTAVESVCINIMECKLHQEIPPMPGYKTNKQARIFAYYSGCFM